MSKNDKSALPEFRTDEEAERFLDEADLSLYDLKTNKRTVQFRIEDEKRVRPLEGPRFEVYLDPEGEFRFRFQDAAGETVFVSGGYKSKAAAMKVIEAVKKTAGDARIRQTPPVKTASGR